MPTKTITIPDSEVEQIDLYVVDVRCPYCNYRNDYEQYHHPPSKVKCIRCDKKFNIKIDKDK